MNMTAEDTNYIPCEGCAYKDLPDWRKDQKGCGFVVRSCKANEICACDMFKAIEK